MDVTDGINQRELSVSQGSRRLESIFFVYATGVLAGGCGVILPACSPYLRQQGILEEQFGLLFVVLLVAAVVTATLRSTWGSHIRLYRAFTLGLLLSFVSQMLIAHITLVAAPWIMPYMLLACAIQGIGGSLVGISGNNAAICLFPEARISALGLFHAAAGTGAALSPLFVASLGASHWWWAPQVAACLMLTVSVWGFSRGEMWFASLDTATAIPQGGLWPVRRGRRWLGMGFLYGVAEATIMYWSVLCLVEHGKLSPHTADQALSGFWLAMTLSRATLAWLYRGVPQRPILGLHMGCFAVSFWLVGAATSPGGAWMALALAGISASVVYPMVMALATQARVTDTSRMVAMISLATTIGQALGAWLTGFLADSFGFDRAFYAGSVWAAAGVALVAISPVAQNLFRRVSATGPKNSPSRMAGGTAEIQPLDGSPMIGPTDDGAHRE